MAEEEVPLADQDLDKQPPETTEDTKTQKSEEKGENNSDSPVKPDGGWGWLVCLGAFITNFVVFGIHNTYGVVYSTLIKELGISSAETAWIGSLGMGLNFFFGPISSALCERIGCRLTSLTGATLGVSGLLLTSFITRKDVSKMYATYGVMWGVGSSFCYVPSMVILGQYFDKRMALANGLGTSGSGVGTLIMAPVIQKLLSTLGWRTTFRFLGGIASLLFIAAWLFKPPPGKDVKEKETPHPCVDLNIWKNKAYIVWVLSISFFLFGYFIPFIHLVRLAGLLGVSADKGAMLISYMSISSTIGRVFFGKLGDLKCVNRLLMFQVAILAIGLSTALLSLAKGYAALVVYSLVFGFFDGCFIGQVAVVTSHIIGVKHLGVALGYLFGTIALPMTLGPPVAGWIYDGSQSYNVAFYVAGCTSFIGFLTMFLIPRLVKKYAEDWERQFDLKRIVSIESRRKLLSNSPSDYGPTARNSFYDIEVFAAESSDVAEPLTQIAVERPNYNRGRRRSLPALYVPNTGPSSKQSSRQDPARLSPASEKSIRLPAEISNGTRHLSLGDQPQCMSRSGTNLAAEKPRQNIPTRARRGSLPVISLTSSSGAPQTQIVLLDANRLTRKAIPLVGVNNQPVSQPMRNRNKRRGSLPAVDRLSLPAAKATHPRVYELGKRRCSLPLVTLPIPERSSPTNMLGRPSKSLMPPRRGSTGYIDEREEDGHEEQNRADVDNQGRESTRPLSTSSGYSTTGNGEGSRSSLDHVPKDKEYKLPTEISV